MLPSGPWTAITPPQPTKGDTESDWFLPSLEVSCAVDDRNRESHAAEPLTGLPAMITITVCVTGRFVVTLRRDGSARSRRDASSLWRNQRKRGLFRLCTNTPRSRELRGRRDCRLGRPPACRLAQFAAHALQLASSSERLTPKYHDRSLLENRSESVLPSNCRIG